MLFASSRCLAKNNKRETPFEVACENERLEIVWLIVQYDPVLLIEKRLLEMVWLLVSHNPMLLVKKSQQHQISGSKRKAAPTLDSLPVNLARTKDNTIEKH